MGVLAHHGAFLGDSGGVLLSLGQRWGLLLTALAILCFAAAWRLTGRRMKSR